MNVAQKMTEALHNGDLQSAQSYFQQVLRTASDEEKFDLAEELYSLGFLEETKSLLKDLLMTYPDETELKVMLAETLVEMDLEEEALMELEPIRREDPLYPRALLLVADLYQMQGLFEVSERKLVEAKSILKEEPVIDFALGELYSEQGKFLEAIRQYDSLLKRNIFEMAGINIHQRMAEALSAGGAFEEALTHFEKAIDHHVDINMLFGYGFTAFQAGMYERAIKQFKRVLEIDKDYHSVYLYLAKSYEHEEQLEDSLQSIELGLEQDSFQKELSFYGGKIAFKLGKVDRAEKYLRDALALDPEYIEAALTLNVLLLAEEKFEEVLEIVNLVNQEGTNVPQFLWDNAKANHALEQYAQALKNYQEAYTDLQENEDFLEEYGYFLLEEGLQAEAQKVFEDLQAKNPTNENIALLLERLASQ
ncbi:tetratricopeptide repeat protein [Bacillus sp. 2205SS5-2]|uniref:tetratricopeptide repeat protein n=1 Tax=Bacillus sp. 2205SS5-2 TaxID=3109031 RepID=UPI00300574FC